MWGVTEGEKIRMIPRYEPEQLEEWSPHPTLAPILAAGEEREKSAA